MSKLSEMIATLCPNGVEYKKLGEIGEFYSGLSGKTKDDFKEGNAKFITYMNVYSNPSLRIDIDDRVKIAKGEKQNVVEYGDVLFTGSSETPDECGMTAVLTQRTDEPLYLNSFCFGFRLRDKTLFEPDFLKHLFRSAELRRQIKRTANGVTRFNVSKAKMANVAIPLPPLPVQREIVQILDNFANLTAELTAELAKRKKQYEHYRDMLFKDSPRMEYLKLDAIAETTVGLATSVTPFIRDNGVLLIHNSDIQQNAIVMKQLVYLDQAFVAKNSKKKFNLNDIVTVHTGEVGTSALITEEYVGSIGFTTLRSRIRDMKKVSPAYLCHYLNSHRCKEAIASKTISDRNNLNQGAFAELTIPLPPLAEQERIVAILDRFDSLCNSLTEGLPAEIALRKKQYEYYRDKLLSFKEAS